LCTISLQGGFERPAGLKLPKFSDGMSDQCGQD
jgi:hypothetical protein